MTTPQPDRPLRVLSLGAGVQSTTVLLMSLAGEIEPFDVAVFADTQAEPAEVYTHLEKLTAEAERQGLRDEQPAEWAEAVRVDREMRAVHAQRIAAGGTSLTGTPYVHRTLVPLDEVDLRTEEDKGQGNLFENDCGAWCGV